ncbi:MAG: class I SAM-dependent methyltransferase [Bacteroidota bacterium]|nr:class I SAM-dependent methyltransferase [Bacteroidota bacterium]
MEKEKDLWNQRYRENPTVYGSKPNEFFKQFIDTHKAGSLLLPAEGEGRNALYAASKGWKVDAFDFSEEAREKALKRAAERKLTIHYQTMRIQDFEPGKKYDAIALIYVHLPEGVRKEFHEKVYKALAPGGFLVLEAFAKEQLRNQSGGPKDKALLYDAPTICGDFPFIHQLYCGQKEVILNEGPFHSGKADVLQLVGQKF